jgi:hypothetical protein
MSDFVYDFHFGDERDYRNDPFDGRLEPVEMSDCNLDNLRRVYREVRDRGGAILEIGLYRNGDRSSTRVFIDEKLDSSIYIGIDHDDKSFLDNHGKNVWTFRSNSSYFKEVVIMSRGLGVVGFDFIFIDGYHSVNQVYDDWRYVQLLNEGGIVGMHDTTSHPGPSRLVESIDRSKWGVERLCMSDYGISFFRRLNGGLK